MKILRSHQLTIVLIFGFLILESGYSQAAKAPKSSPNSCVNIPPTTDLATYLGEQVDDKINVSDPATGMDLYNSRALVLNTPWPRNGNLWTSKGIAWDFTGVSGWNDTSGTMEYLRGATLISPRHFVEACHFAQNVGARVGFIDANGNQVIRTVANAQVVINDICMGVLDSDVPDTIAYYPIMSSQNLSNTTMKNENDMLKVPYVAFNQFAQAYLQYVRYVGSNNGTVYSVNSDQLAAGGTYTDGQRALFGKQVIVGDSGQPSFLVIDDQPVLLGTWISSMGISNVGSYIKELNAAMISLGNNPSNYQVTEYNPTCFIKYPLFHSPVFSSNINYIPLNQWNIDPTRSVYTIKATDVDSQNIAYNFLDLNSIINNKIFNPLDYFSLNPTTGELHQIKSIDPTVYGQQLNLPIQATAVGQYTTTTTQANIPILLFNFDPSKTNVQIDPQYNTTLLRSVPSTLAIDSHDRLTLANVNYSVGETSESMVYRLRSDGSLDSSFNSAILPDSNQRIMTMFVQGNGKTVLGGYLSNFDGVRNNRVLRLNCDGSLDNSFNNNVGNATQPTGWMFNLAPFKDSIILSGSPSNVTSRNPTLLNYDGKVNAIFQNNSMGAGFNVRTSPKVLQYGNKMLFGGGFNFFNGFPEGRLMSFNVDGSLDTAFNQAIGAGFDGQVNDIGTLSNGKIVVVGFFNYFQNTLSPHIVLLNPDGSLDASFTANLGSSFDNSISSVLVQPDDKILVYGSFQIFNGRSVGNLVRLNPDGTLDNAFQNNIGTGLNGKVTPFNPMVQKKDGTIIISGNLSDLNQVPVPNVIAIVTPPQNPPTLLAPSTSTSTVVAVSGVASPFAIVKVFEGYTLLTQTNADQNGTWNTSVNLKEGQHSLRALQSLTVTNTQISALSSKPVLVTVKMAYTLIVNSSGNGQINVDPLQQVYLSGQNVKLTAIPASGYRFNGWSGSFRVPRNPLTVTMRSNLNVLGNFIPNPVDGVCSDVVNSCVSGAFVDTTDSSTMYQWSCKGISGGSSASCTFPKRILINKSRFMLIPSKQ